MMMEEAQAAYGAGQQAFERGLYRESVQYLLQARSMVESQSALGGAIALWLVNAYEANGQREEARALCRQLKSHGDHQTRVQSRRLLYILEAPQLQLKQEWLTQIPDLNNPTLQKTSSRVGRSVTQTQADKTSKPKYEFTLLDSEEDKLPRDNGFLWLALGVSLMTILGLLWLGRLAP
jgi:hypothetical protein